MPANRPAVVTVIAALLVWSVAFGGGYSLALFSATATVNGTFETEFVGETEFDPIEPAPAEAFGQSGGPAIAATNGTADDVSDGNDAVTDASVGDGGVGNESVGNDSVEADPIGNDSVENDGSGDLASGLGENTVAPESDGETTTEPGSTTDPAEPASHESDESEPTAASGDTATGDGDDARDSGERGSGSAQPP